MATDNHASYTRIGFTVFVGVAAIVATLVYLGGVRGRGDELLVETSSDQPVGGLSVGSAVNFRGVKVGEVREISFVGNKYAVDGADSSRIYILMAIKVGLLWRDAPDGDQTERNLQMLVDRRGLRATVASSGITGLSHVEMNFNPPDQLETPTISWRPEHPYVPAKTSLMENFSVAATKVMNQINRMDLESVWSNVSATVEAVALMSGFGKSMLESRQAEVERIVDDLAATAASLRELSSELRRNPSLLLRERTPARLRETE
ncbi:MAG: MlaD family protein [Kiritimatiellia bacterium]